METFIDPRSAPKRSSSPPRPRVTRDPEELSDLHEFCREGRLYDVERWIRDGHPLQLPDGRPAGRRRWSSALEIGLENGIHALVLLLLCNGYDPNRERHCPLNRTLEDRRFDLLELLLGWGADPHRVCLSTLFGTYDSKLFERFRKLGVNLTAGHAIASALAHHTSNKPLYGYAKRHRKGDAQVQEDLNIALAHHAAEGNEKGVSLCLWAGADPHAPAPSLRYGDWADDDDDEAERFVGFSAVYEACSRGHVGILEKLGPDPDVDDFDALYSAAESRAVVDHLARIALPDDVEAVIQRQLWSVAFLSRGWGSLWTLERLFEVGTRWESSSKEAIAGLRRQVLKLPKRTFVDLMKLLAKDDYCSPDILEELARTPAMRRQMKEVGFIPPEPDDPDRHRWHRERPTRFREVLKKCGIELRKPKRPLPRILHIGSSRSGAQEVRMSRRDLFERIWTEPVTSIAEEWGLSGRGLAKACKRIKVPTPPRGYWPKVRAGKRVRRPRLTPLPDGQVEEVVVWVTEQAPVRERDGLPDDTEESI